MILEGSGIMRLTLNSVFPVDASVRIEWVSECLKEFIDDFRCQISGRKD